MARTRKGQQALEFPEPPLGWGGVRKGAGRKSKGRVSRRKRPNLSRHHPVHVNVHVIEGLPSLRRDAEYMVLVKVFEQSCERDGFRLVHYSVQHSHLHMIVEAANRRTLTRGMRGLLVRAARALNRLWNRQGRIVSDRFHEHVLRAPREVRNALAYVLNNARRHGARIPIDVPDSRSSGRFFEGWLDYVAQRCPGFTRPIAAAHTWLLNVGWLKHGPIPLATIPGA